MNTHRIQLALKVAETRSISKAAKELYLSQPTVSENIRALEQEVGFPIFYRSNRVFEVTEKGREFLRRAAVIQEQLEQIDRIKLAQERCRMRFATFNSLRIERAFLRFCKNHLDCDRLQISYDLGMFSVSQAVELLRDGQADIVLSVCGADRLATAKRKLNRDKYAYFVLGTQDIVLIVSEDHPLSTAELTIEELSQHIIILPCDLSIGKWFFLPELVDSGPWKRQIQAHSRSMRLKLAADGAGFLVGAPLAESTLERYHLVSRPLFGQKAAYLCICAKPHQDDPYVQELLSLIREEFPF